ncbi:MAG: hypothetical protein RBQ79_05995, partial [Sphaerochaetaceae bacterium]|nr:hypothetical protein [Sphaerochaetaceae bacterium]
MNMKKAIAILLVVLVAGVMFGATDTLTIESTVTARTNHGFYAAQISPLNFGKIYSATTLGNNTYT